MAASPEERINFQGVLRDASGAPVVDGNYEMVFRFFGNGAGACDCGQANGSPGCSDASCQADVCAVDSFCCNSTWDLVCSREAEQFASCQACIANEEVLIDSHVSLVPVAVTDGLFNAALGSGSLADGSGAGVYLSLGQLFRDFDVVYVEPQVNGQILSPRIRVESSAFTQNALHLEGKRATEFLDTTAAAQVKAGPLEVQGDVTVGGNVEFADGSVLMTARPDPPCFDNVTRFVDCGNGTVTDQITGLIWLKDANCFGQQTYAAANSSAAALGDGQCGLTDGSAPGDWRLPTAGCLPTVVNNNCGPADSEPATGEWASLMRDKDVCFDDIAFTGVAVPDTAGSGCWTEGDPFTSVQADRYWSSSNRRQALGHAWAAQLFVGGVVDSRAKGGTQYVWPVRGGNTRPWELD